MKKIVIFTCLLAFFSTNVFSQVTIDETCSKKYIGEEWDASTLVKLIDAVDFKPATKPFKGVDIKYFKATLLGTSEKDIELYRRGAWYLCSTKHDADFELWNILYTKINKTFWDEYCKGLIMLMIIDGTVKP